MSNGIEATELALTLAVEVGKEMAPAALGGPMGLAVGAVPGVVGFAWDRWRGRCARRVEKLVETLKREWAADAGMTPEEVAARLEVEAKNNSDFAETISRSVRALIDAPSERAAVALGVLVADYGRLKRRPDVFLRGVVRLVCDLEDVEIDELAAVLDWVLATVKREAIILRALDSKQKPDKTWERIPWTMDIHLDDPDQPDLSHRRGDRAVCPIHPTDGERLLHVLKWSGLGFEQVTGGLGGVPPMADLRRTTVERLVRILKATKPST